MEPSTAYGYLEELQTNSKLDHYAPMGHILNASATARADRPHAAPSATATPFKGSLDGHVLTYVPNKSSTATPSAHHDQNSGLPTVQKRELLSRGVLVENLFRSLLTADIFQKGHLMGADPVAIRGSARDLLRGSSIPVGTGRAAKTNRYLALHLAAACLDDEVDAESVTALLTPSKSRTENSQDLADLIQRAADNEEEFQRIVEDILSGLDTTPQDAAELTEKLRHARYEPGKLTEILRKAQKIPTLSDQEKRLLRTQIEEQLHEFERSSDGAQVLASFNATPTATQTSEPTVFLNTYSDLVTETKSFGAALKLLLSRYALDAIEETLSNLKKALGDDLAATVPSQDPIRLGAILTDLSTMHISTTLVEMVKSLVSLIQRVDHVQAA